MLDNNGANIGIVAAGNNLYQLHNSGRIWRSPVFLAAANPARAGRCWTTTAGRAA
jgi:hypothetical protein